MFEITIKVNDFVTANEDEEGSTLKIEMTIIDETLFQLALRTYYIMLNLILTLN